MFDRESWKQDHAALVEEIRRLKKLRTTPHQPEFKGREIYALLDAKERATLLYLVRAAVRGRVHPCRALRAGSWEEKQRIKKCEELRLKYTRPDPEVASEKPAPEVETRTAV